MDPGSHTNNLSILRMFLIWKRSVYKVVYKEALVFVTLFCIISVVYRNCLDGEQKK